MLDRLFRGCAPEGCRAAGRTRRGSALTGAVLWLACLTVAGATRAHAAGDLRAEQARWRALAADTQIVRDDWGIAHVHGRTDADAVFGMAYAQAEDDFNRIESNYLTALGRVAEAEGPAAVMQDLRQRLFIDPAVLQADYARSPPWLVALMQAWADGLNDFLATHPQVHPRVLTHFEPWMALSFTEGSIGGDIERVKLGPLQAFYTGRPVAMSDAPRDLALREPGGSNGIAIAPADTRDGHALLLINPHTSFYFRSELQMSSDAGLDAYGAVTWGQFFIYQGFNPHIGWMHTSTGADNVDEFAETIVHRHGRLFYRYGHALRPVRIQQISIRYRTAGGGLAVRTFTTYATHHGPIIREADGHWIAIALMNRPIAALEQSFLRTKASDYASYLQVAQLQANSSNNTVFADDKGEIAYLHPQFMPRRDDRFDYTRPVDGADPATDWHGLTPLDQLPHLLDPPNGWIFNTNDAPWSAAGPYSPKRQDFPRYMDRAGENPRGLHATLLLTGHKDFTLESLEAAAFDSYQPAFAQLIPKLVQAYDALPAQDTLRARLHDQIELLRGWDDRWSDHSLATSLAVFWGDALWQATAPQAAAARPVGLARYQELADAPASEQLQLLAQASDRLEHDFGNWRVPWGEINRFQRVDDTIVPTFSDASPSIPVPFTYSRWGSLASFAARRYPGTRRYYGTAGNSFVAVVEFGPRIRAVAVTAGGESGDPRSAHFDDEAIRYARGQLRPVYFYPAQLQGHIERSYHPGE
ncbi:MAG TPA: penicillin acylase family protein [Steroidobacteraceae bacterium]|nr:penicillin acylase family protein [Steroidobacteraceae bacterium]